MEELKEKYKILENLDEKTLFDHPHPLTIF